MFACKNLIPYCGLTLPLEAMNFTNFNISESSQVNLNFSGTVVLKNKIYKDSPYICISMQNFDPLLWPHPTPGGHDFHKLESALCQEVSM